MTRTESENARAVHDPATRFVANAVDRLIRIVPVLASSRRTTEMIVRFAWVGGTSSLLYALVVAVAVSGLSIQHDLATLVAFAVLAPMNFLLHRSFTFHSRGLVGADLARYLSMQVFALFVALAVMALCVDLFGLPYFAGIVAAVVLVPIVNFLVMNRWVFALKAI